MLEAARQALCEIGALQPDEPMPPFSVRMSGNLVFLVYPKRAEFYLVKVGIRTDLSREYGGFAAGHAAFPTGVPKPLALSRHRSFPTLVTTGVRFQPLGSGPMKRPTRRLERCIAVHFDGAAKAFRTRTERPHSTRIRAAFATLEPAPDWPRYVEAIADEVDRLPAVLQHGDFYINNLGLGRDALVVLDWEDFGRECLPGFDVALLLLSLNDFDVVRLRANIEPRAPHAWIVDAGCAPCGIPPPVFVELLPAYVALLARMKIEMGYGEAFSARAMRALRESLALWPEDAAIRGPR